MTKSTKHLNTPVTSRTKFDTQGEMVDAALQHLSVVRSCALLMTHTASLDIRSQYLQTLNHSARIIDSVLRDLESGPLPIQKER